MNFLLRYIHGRGCCGSFATVVLKVPITDGAFVMPRVMCEHNFAELEYVFPPQRSYEP